MSCLEWEEKIAQFVDGDLDPAEMLAVVEHLRGCVSCAEWARALEEDSRRLRRPPELGAIDLGALRGRVRRETVRVRRRKKLLPALLLAASLAIAWAMVEGLKPRRMELARTAPPAAVAITLPEKAVPSALPRVRAHPKVRRAEAQADPVLEAALREFTEAHQPAPPATPASPIEMRIATRDPHVVIILVSEIEGGPHE